MLYVEKQDGLKILPFRGMSIMERSDIDKPMQVEASWSLIGTETVYPKYYDIEIYGDSESYIVSRYETLERAIEVKNDIKMAILNGRDLYTMPKE